MLNESMFGKSETIILNSTKVRPDTLVILGSGLGSFVDNLEKKISINYKDIFPVKSEQVEGHGGVLHIGLLCGKPIYCMQGRNHYYEGYTDEEMRFPILLFARLKVKNLIVTNACGGMNENFEPGDLMLITDHINMMGKNPMTGAKDSTIGPRFFDMSEPYNHDLISLAEKIAATKNIKLQKGVYVGYGGPSYETKSEIKAFIGLGGDAVGMSTVPEVIVANHAGMKVLGISCITNMATGIQKGKLSHKEVINIADKASAKLALLLHGIICDI